LHDDITITDRRLKYAQYKYKIGYVARL